MAEEDIELLRLRAKAKLKLQEETPEEPKEEGRSTLETIGMGLDYLDLDGPLRTAVAIPFGGASVEELKKGLKFEEPFPSGKEILKRTGYVQEKPKPFMVAGREVSPPHLTPTPGAAGFLLEIIAGMAGGGLLGMAGKAAKALLPEIKVAKEVALRAVEGAELLKKPKGKELLRLSMDEKIPETTARKVPIPPKELPEGVTIYQGMREPRVSSIPTTEQIVPMSKVKKAQGPYKTSIPSEGEAIELAGPISKEVGFPIGKVSPKAEKEAEENVMDWLKSDKAKDFGALPYPDKKSSRLAQAKEKILSMVEDSGDKLGRLGEMLDSALHPASKFAPKKGTEITKKVLIPLEDALEKSYKSGAKELFDDYGLAVTENLPKNIRRTKDKLYSAKEQILKQADGMGAFDMSRPIERVFDKNLDKMNKFVEDGLMTPAEARRYYKDYIKQFAEVADTARREGTGVSVELMDKWKGIVDDKLRPSAFKEGWQAKNRRTVGELGRDLREGLKDETKRVLDMALDPEAGADYARLTEDWGKLKTVEPSARKISRKIEPQLDKIDAALIAIQLGGLASGAHNTRYGQTGLSALGMALAGKQAYRTLRSPKAQYRFGKTLEKSGGKLRLLEDVSRRGIIDLSRPNEGEEE